MWRCRRPVEKGGILCGWGDGRASARRPHSAQWSMVHQPLPRACPGLLQVPVPGLPRGMMEPGFSHSPDLPSPPHLPLSLSSSLLLLPSHGCFIFRVQGSSPKPITFTLWNENLFYFPFPVRLLCELYPGSLPLLLVLKWRGSQVFSPAQAVSTAIIRYPLYAKPSCRSGPA